MKSALRLAFSASGLAASMAMAQVPTPSISPDVAKTRIRIGYGISPDFDLRAGGQGHLEGPEIGLDLPILNFEGIGVCLSPSIFMGGRLRHGSDTDGNIYRFMATANHTLGGNIGGKVGVGLAHSEPRNREFDSKNGVIGQVGLSTSLTSGFLSHLTPRVELNYYFSNSNQLRGFFLGLSGGL